MGMPPPSELHASADWAEMRRLYEQEGVSRSEIQRRFGFRSGTTIARRIRAEDWRSPRNPLPLTLQYGDSGEVAVAADDAPAPDDEVTVIPMAALVAERALRDTARQIMDDAPGSPEVIGPSHLAALHTERIKEQLAMSKEVTNVGRLVLSRIAELFTAGDEGSMERARAALVSLTNVNPDKDTLAGLLKAAADVVRQGVTIERLALGMDTRRKPGEQNNPIPELVSPKRAAGALIAQMDPEMAFKLRALAQRTILERRQREIQTQVEDGE